MKMNRLERLLVNSPFRVFEQVIEIHWLGKAIPLTPGFTALEIGCGRGAGARHILREFKPAMIHAMDIDLYMLRKAQRYLSSEDKQRIFLFAGDASRLPVRTGSVDAVFGFGVLHHIIDWRSALLEIARVLKRDGTYFLEELYPPFYRNIITKRLLLHPEQDRFSSDDLKEELAEVKLCLRKYKELKRIGILGAAVKE